MEQVTAKLVVYVGELGITIGCVKQTYESVDVLQRSDLAAASELMSPHMETIPLADASAAHGRLRPYRRATMVIPLIHKH
jgi:hypothetical protein